MPANILLESISLRSSQRRVITPLLTCAPNAGGWRTWLNLILFSCLSLMPLSLSAITFRMEDKLVVNGASTFNSSATIVVPISQSSSLWASTSPITPHLYVSTNGNIGISTRVPQGRLDVKDDGKTVTDMVQIWRDSDGTIVSSMSATGVMKAVKFLGDGSGLTNNGDNLGNHVATTTLNMSGQSMINVASGTFNKAVTVNSSVTVVNTDNTLAVSLWVSSSPITPHLYVSTDGAVTIARYRAVDNGTDPGTVNLTVLDFGKTFVSTGTASTTQYNLPVVNADHVGAQLMFVKLGPGKVTIAAPANTYISDSGGAGTVYNGSTIETYATITLRLISASMWAIAGGDGSWTTTAP